MTPRLSILLVEDDPGDALLVEMALRSCRVTRAETLKEAIEARSNAGGFDVILQDLSLPDSHGFKTVASMRWAYPETPIIVLTGLDDPALEHTLVEFGAQDYLVKGCFDDQALMRAIRHAIVRQGLERRLVESETEHRTVVNLAPDAIMVVTPGQVIASANPAAIRMFGSVDLIGTPLSGHLPDAPPLLGKYEGEARADGMAVAGTSSFPVSMAVAPLGDGRFVIMVRDITEWVSLTRELRQMARTDPLTGIANRRVFVEAAEGEFQRAKRFGTEAALLMIDIDHFKRVNDTYGHEAGDKALVAFARVLAQAARSTDLAARFGGEEFMLLLPGTDLAGSIETAERLRESAAAIRVGSTAGEFGFTISVGASSFDFQDCDWNAAQRRADSALYRAKEAGRNRVVAFGGPFLDGLAGGA